VIGARKIESNQGYFVDDKKEPFPSANALRLPSFYDVQFICGLKFLSFSFSIAMMMVSENIAIYH